MNKTVLKELIKQAWHYALAYITHYLWPILKDTLEKTKEYFINLLWESVKEEFTLRAKGAVEFIETFFNGPDYKEKEKAAIDTLFKNVNLPLLLKPFKPLLKKIFKKKVSKLVKKFLDELDVKA